VRRRTRQDGGVSSTGQVGGLAIGAELTRAREELGLEIRELEERTKIRGRYLRALEEEAWDVIPSPAYAKGFLRTYAAELGLDAEELVDEFRRQVESRLPDSERAYPIGDRVLEERRRPGSGPSGRLAPLAIVAVIVLVAVAGIAFRDLISGDEESPPGSVKVVGPGNRGEQRREPRGGTKRFELILQAREDVELCLVKGRRQALIDAQTVRADSSEGPFQGKEFRLDVMSGGTLLLELDGRRVRVSSREPARYIVTSRGARPAAYPQRDRAGCP